MSALIVEELWKKNPYSLQYHKTVPPQPFYAAQDVLRYYWSKFPEHEHSKIPLSMDIACGTGQISELIASSCSRIIASDISPAQIKVARESSTHNNVSYEVSSVYDISQFLNDGEKVDLITCSGSSHYFNNERFYNEVRRCLKKGGILAECTYRFFAFPGLPSDAIGEHINFWKSQCSHSSGDKNFEEMLNHVCNGYRDLKFLLEEEERSTYTFDHEWTKEEISNYVIYGTMKSENCVEKVHKFYSYLWDTYNIGEKLLVRFEANNIFTRNLCD